jgi:DNA-binding NtrC family response regulator
LENTIFRAIVLAEGEEITIRELPQLAARIGDFDAGDGRTQAPVHAMLVPSDDIGAQQLCEPQRRFASGVPHSNGDNSPEHAVMPAAAADGSGSMLNLLNDDGNVRALEDIEADVIRFALAHYRGQISEAARRLRIGRSTLYRKLEMPGLEMTATEQASKWRRGDTRDKNDAI